MLADTSMRESNNHRWWKIFLTQTRSETSSRQVAPDTMLGCYFSGDLWHHPFWLNRLWFQSCEIRKQAEKLGMPLVPYPAGCLIIAQRSFYPVLAPAWPFITFKFQWDQIGWHKVTQMFVLLSVASLVVHSCGSWACAVRITVWYGEVW